MIYSLAVFPPAIVFQIIDSDPRLSPSPIPLETSRPNTPIVPDQSPVSASDIQDLRYISAALAKSMIEASTLAQSLGQESLGRRGTGSSGSGGRTAVRRGRPPRRGPPRRRAWRRPSRPGVSGGRRRWATPAPTCAARRPAT